MIMTKQGFHAFTTKYNGLVKQLVNDVHVGSPFDVERLERKDEIMQGSVAIWDTGATGSVITKRLVDLLNLKPISKQAVRGVTGEKLSNVYMVHIMLPNNMLLTYVRVIECEDILGDSSLLIGMDIISLGDFSITNVKGKTVMSYRYPSLEVVDYVAQANSQNSLMGMTE